jgi:hypothetical protein
LRIIKLSDQTSVQTQGVPKKKIRYLKDHTCRFSANAGRGRLVTNESGIFSAILHATAMGTPGAMVSAGNA